MTKKRTLANCSIKDARKLFPKKMVGLSALMTILKNYTCNCCSFEDVSSLIIKYRGV
jgi:hypothetical protein